MGLVAAADIAVAAEGVNFCLSEVKLGLIPATISPDVIRAMGQSAARRYFLTAERFAAAEALRIGFVHAVCKSEELDATVQGIVASLLAASPNAVTEAKRLVHDVAGAPLSQALIDETVARIADIRASRDGREGVQSFLQKRKPDWLV
jgi:methylglutaconyl-CoA hydratase